MFNFGVEMVKIFSLSAVPVGEINLPEEVFGVAIDEDLIHRVVTWQLAKKRSGTHVVKGRSDVVGSTRKIYRQKGTGNARHGALTAPQFRGGGVAFGPVLRSHEYKLNKKVRALALRMVLSLKVMAGNLVVIDDMALATIKTSFMSNCLKSFGINSVLLIDNLPNEELKKSIANLYKVDILPVCGLNVYDILQHKTLFLSLDALNSLKERFL